MADYHERLFEMVRDAYGAEIDRRDRLVSSLRLSLTAAAMLFGGVAFVFDRVSGVAGDTLRAGNLKTACLFLLTVTALLLFASMVNFLFILPDQDVRIVKTKAVYETGLAIIDQDSSPQKEESHLAFLLYAGGEYARAAADNTRRNDGVVRRRHAGFLMLLIAVYLLFFAFAAAAAL